MKNLKIMKGEQYYPYTNGVYGTFVVRGTNYSFSAKIYNEPSHWGMVHDLIIFLENYAVEEASNFV